ncbi:unnamed protein product, partial [Lampetra planeri]
VQVAGGGREQWTLQLRAHQDISVEWWMMPNHVRQKRHSHIPMCYWCCNCCRANKRCGFCCKT